MIAGSSVADVANYTRSQAKLLDNQLVSLAAIGQPNMDAQIPPLSHWLRRHAGVEAPGPDPGHADEEGGRAEDKVVRANYSYQSDTVNTLSPRRRIPGPFLPESISRLAPGRRFAPAHRFTACIAYRTPKPT